MNATFRVYFTHPSYVVVLVTTFYSVYEYILVFGWFYDRFTGDIWL